MTLIPPIDKTIVPKDRARRVSTYLTVGAGLIFGLV